MTKFSVKSLPLFLRIASRRIASLRIAPLRVVPLRYASLRIAFICLALLLSAFPGALVASGPMAPPRIPAFRVLVLASRASDHLKMIAAARPRLEKIAAENNYSLDFTDDTSKINDANLAGYQVFVMLHLAPFDMSYAQQAALQKFVQQGKGWVGIHAAGLTGKEFLAPNSRYWDWFEEFMGGVTYSPHPKYQQATVMVEDADHPVTRGLPDRFSISDEWYEFTTSPRSHVRVLASVDESTYRQNHPMGDHPIVWTNERYRRMIYIGIGHDPSVFDNDSYTRLLTNAIQWASSISIPMKGRIVDYEKDYAWSTAQSGSTTQSGNAVQSGNTAKSGNAAQSANAALSKKERMDKAVQWLIRSFPSMKDSIRRDERTGAIKAKGIFTVNADPGAASPSAGEHLFKLRFDIALTIDEKGYSCRAYNFYENSNEKGFSHEYSKIEYRWWDFRLNHPWYPTDRPLFNGLDSTTRSLIKSLYAVENPGAPYPAQSPSYSGASSATSTETSPGGLSSKTPADLYLQPPFTLHPRFRVLALYENGGHHIEFSLRARTWLNRLAADSNFIVDYRTHTDSITPAFLANYQLILQLDYVPYGWKAEAMTAFQQYIEEGRGGWVGFHHATLLGEFDGFPMWPWFYNFMGSIRWKDYIARFAKATVRIEDRSHPIMQGIPDSLVIQKEEWYTYDKSPRPNVHVLASVDESTYMPDTTVKMGDHPVIWTNPSVRARNIYIFMGHTPILFNDAGYRRLVSNAIFWAAAGSSLSTAASPPSAAVPSSAAAESTGTQSVSQPAASSPAARKPASAPKPSFRALAFFSNTVEPDHVDFAYNAIQFYTRLAAERGFVFDTTTNWTNCNEHLKRYQLVLWLNDFPHTEDQRQAFQQYMETGGAWLGFHVSGYNDKGTHWPWFVHFFGDAVFYNNNWPPLPAQMIVNDTKHPVTRELPAHYKAPINEWYGWQPNPRLNKDIKVLVTLDPVNYPLGKKDIIDSGDIPVVWTNTRYKMLYMNMGHGDQNFASPLQNTMFKNAILWLGARSNAAMSAATRK